MKTTIQEQDGNMVAILEGRLDTVAAPETEKAMNVLNDVEDKDIIRFHSEWVTPRHLPGGFYSMEKIHILFDKAAGTV